MTDNSVVEGFGVTHCKAGHKCHNKKNRKHLMNNKIASVRLYFNEKDSFLLSNLLTNITFQQLIQDVKFRCGMTHLIGDVCSYSLQYLTNKKPKRYANVQMGDRLDAQAYLSFFAPVLQLYLKPTIDHSQFEKLFGAPLEFNCYNPVHRGFDSRGYCVPRVVSMSMDFLGKNVTHEGIFRVNGSAKAIEQWKKTWNFGEYAFTEFEENTAVNDVASMLKQYLRELPDSLVPGSLKKSVKELFASSVEDKLPDLQKLINQLPTGHFTVLELLMSLCLRIQENAAVNKMDADNLATCLAPSIFSDKSADTKDPAKLMESVQEANIFSKAVSFMIKNADQLFTRSVTIEEQYRDQPNTGALIVEIIRCHNLIAADVNKSSDPWVKISLHNQTLKTRVIKKNLNPVFNQQFELAVVDPVDDILMVQIFDHDQFTRHDELGHVEIPVKDASKKRCKVSGAYDVHNAKHGTIELSIMPFNYGN